MDFWWLNISQHYILIVAHYDGCHIIRTGLIAEIYLRPTDKPRALLEGWSINLTNIELMSLEVYCIVTIDCFTKWTEVWLI